MEQNSNKEQVFHNLPTSSSFSLYVLILFIIVILLGVGSGYLLAKHNAGGVIGNGSATNANSSSVVVGATYGSGDTGTFKDMAEGIVQKGGIGSEGQYHLVRSGGASQYVYMTSSLVDLSQFINHKVKVWGQTQKAQQAGWLMDVGRLEVEE